MIDEIVEEIRINREAHAEKFNYNLRKIYEDLKESEIKHIHTGHSFVEPPIKQTFKSLHRTTAPLSFHSSR